MKNRETQILSSIKKQIRLSYGFITNPALTPAHNAALVLSEMPTWHYFSRPYNLAAHDLTSNSTTLPRCITNIIGLGLKFIPTPARRPKQLTPDLIRFQKDFLTKVYFAGKPLHNEDYIPRLHTPSHWTPKEWDVPRSVTLRLSSFEHFLHKVAKQRRHSEPNLLPYQKRALASLASRDDVLVIACDKNLGPALIDRSTYITKAFEDHLDDKNTYLELTQEKAKAH